MILTFIKYPTGDNIKVCLINFIILIVFFSLDSYKNKHQLKNEIYIFSLFYAVLTFIFSVISLVIIFTKIEPDFTGLFYNENAFGIFTGISIALSLYCLSSKKLDKLKYFLIFNVAIQLISLVISGGRSSFLILASLVLIYIFMKIKSVIVKSLIILVPTATFFTLLFFTPNITHYIFTGRENIWRAAFKLIKLYPLTGVGKTQLVPTIDKLRDIWLYGVEAGGMHNIYIKTAAVNGLISLLLFLFILIFIIIFIYKKLIKNFSLNSIISFSLIIGLLLVNFMESSILYSVNFICITFWTVCGYTLAILSKE